MKILGLITARAGSQGIPKKNKKLFAGKPLIEWTIEAALKAKMIDEVVISTDDWDIAELGIRCGAQVPFLRPDYLAEDDTPHIEVIKHALREVGPETFTHCCLLQPTSPLRSSNDIEEACILAAKNCRASVVSVDLNKEYPFILKATPLKGMEEPPKTYLRRQEIVPKCHVNGAIFIAPVDRLLKKNTVYIKPILPYVMPKNRSIQIDDQIDFDIAEFIMYGLLEDGKK